MIITADGFKRRELQEEIVPAKIIQSKDVEGEERLFVANRGTVSFRPQGFSVFLKKGSYILLDFGKELCGGVRILMKGCGGLAKWRLTFGESVTEACANVGEKNAGNDHSARDMEIVTSQMSDAVYGSTGFRFVRLELLSEVPSTLQNIFAVSHLPVFEQEGEIVTNDSLLNQIIDTATYTLKLCYQQGYIWDGIKRDRLVWSGDLNPEILTGLYLFGDNENIRNSLDVLAEETEKKNWVNTIPSYSAWWVINLCDYCRMTGNIEFYQKHQKYAKKVIAHFNECITDEGEMILKDGYGMEYYLDWSTFEHKDAVTGVACLIRMMAQKFLEMEASSKAERIVEKLAHFLEDETTMKPVRAFQILAGRPGSRKDAKMLGENGCEGFSTFMAYYILKALAKCGEKNMLALLKEYYGGMLSKGATTFWEDFDIHWLENSNELDRFPQEGEKDIHGDFGKHCYTGFRHSLCHGWSAGVLAFVVEYILGISIRDQVVSFAPHASGLTEIQAKLPLKNGKMNISIHGEERHITVPDDVEIK